jgi:hypothetical protein
MDDSTKRLFKYSVQIQDVFSQGFIDESLIAPASRAFLSATRTFASEMSTPVALHPNVCAMYRAGPPVPQQRSSSSDRGIQ